MCVCVSIFSDVVCTNSQKYASVCVLMLLFLDSERWRSRNVLQRSGMSEELDPLEAAAGQTDNAALFLLHQSQRATRAHVEFCKHATFWC